MTDRIVAAGEEFACQLVEHNLACKDREGAGHSGEVLVPGHLRARDGAEEHRNLRLGEAMAAAMGA